MAPQEKQALQDFPAITAALPAVDGGLSTVTNSAIPHVIHSSYRKSAGVPGQGAGCSEIGRAIDLLNSMAVSVKNIHIAGRRRQPLQMGAVKQDIDALIDNFAHEPNTLFWALAANRRMYHLSRRAVGCAVWALALGSHLDFEHTALHELMLGAAMLDIGKLKVPVVILAKGSKLNQSERNFVRRHVAEGVRMLESVDGLSAASIEMVRSHHERLDGSGYPFGLRGDEISLYAQIAGIVDSFDALSLNRYYAEGLSGHAALDLLQAQRGDKFAPQLIDQFISAIGETPTGSWVEFPDGSMGIVCSQDAEPGAPQVALIADEDQQPFLAVRWLSLDKASDARLLSPAERPRHAAAMERSLQAAIYGARPRKY